MGLGKGSWHPLALVLLTLAGWSGAATAGAEPALRPQPDPRQLERRVHELERQNADLLRRLERLERGRTGSMQGATDEPGPPGVVVGTPAPPEHAADAGHAAHPGLASALANVRTSFTVFADAGFGYQDPPEPDNGKSAFALGALDFFATAQAGERFQVMTEIVLEGENTDNEFGIEVERLLGLWTFNDALYLKVGREHSPQSRWNRRYHHGRWLWTSATQPFLARFEDDGGPLQVHQVGLEAGGHVRTAGGTLEYTGVVSNGRGRTPTEVANFGDHNGNKALDLGLGFSPSVLRGLTFGGSFHADDIPTLPGDPARRHGIRELVETAYLEHFTGALETIGEFAWIQHADRTSGRTFHHRAGYLQLGYHLGAFTPFTRFDARNMARRDPFYASDGLDLDEWDQVLGVRYDVTEYLAFKLEGGAGREQRRDAGGNVSRRGVGRLAAQLALVF